MTTTTEVIRNYESVIILHPDLTEADQKAFFKKNSEIIKGFKGEMNHIDTWGKRKLGNTVENLRVGTYFHSTFTASPACIKELERTMRINDKVIRFQHTRLDERIPLSKHVEGYREVLSGSTKREQEREAKIQSKKAARPRK